MAQRDKQQRLTRLERVADIAKEEEPKYALPAAWEFGYDLVNDPEAYARAARELCPSLTDAEISAILAGAARRGAAAARGGGSLDEPARAGAPRSGRGSRVLSSTRAARSLGRAARPISSEAGRGAAGRQEPLTGENPPTVSW